MLFSRMPPQCKRCRCAYRSYPYLSFEAGVWCSEHNLLVGDYRYRVHHCVKFGERPYDETSK